MGFVALTRLRWGDGFIEPGDPVPSHEGRRYDRMLADGLISGEPDPLAPARIVVPFTTLSPATEWALHSHPVEYVDVSGSDTAYFELLSDLWRAGDAFICIEQDVTVLPDTIASFERCERQWCQAPYPYLSSPNYPGLGCCRFRAALLRSHPDVMDDVAEHEYPPHPKRHWCPLDASIQRELWKRRRGACMAHSTVMHRSGPPSHGCCG